MVRRRDLKPGLVIAALALTACATSPDRHLANRDLLFSWASDANHKNSDFLAVIDLRSEQILATVPVGQSGTLAHHTDYSMPKDGTLFANDFYSGKTWVFDLSNPRQPRLRATFADAGPISFAHSFARLPGGHVLATFQRGDHANKSPGGIAEFSTDGRLLRWSSADPHSDEFVRPYSLAIVPKLDRIVTTTADMGNMPGMPAMPTAGISRSVQIWRMSDLKLLHTLVLPPGPAGDEQQSPNEPRLLADGRTVLVGTGKCGLYRLGGIAGPSPSATFVHAIGQSGCAVPVVAGHFWVIAIQNLPGLVSLDISDPSHPREVSRLMLDKNWVPHWLSLAPDGRRLVVTGFKNLRSKALIAAIDPASGQLSLTGKVIDFSQTAWPDGSVGPAIPHGTVFARHR